MQRRAYLGDKFKYQWYLCYQAKKCELTLVDVEFLEGFMDFVSHESRNDACNKHIMPFHLPAFITQYLRYAWYVYN